ncbi:hypothetical protein ABPG74_019397 [Tetrahymena malaccensis]
MDKVYHFKGKTTQGHLKHMTDNQAGFYSEEEVEDTPPSIKPSETKKSSFQSNFALANSVNLQDDQRTKQRGANEQENNDFEEFTIRNPSQTVGYTKPTHQHSNSYSNNLKVGPNSLTADIKSRFLTNHSVSTVDSDAEARRIAKKNEIIDALQSHPFRHLIFSNSVTEATFKKHLTLTYRGLVYARKCLKGPSDKFIKSKQVAVPDSKYPKGKTLLLDLDETLIHSCSLKENPDHIIKAKADNDDKVGYQIGLRVRPYCLEFLQKLAQYWDIYIFTASSPTYASAIVKFLDPEGKYINGILNRSNCMETKNGFFIKDLRIVKGKDLKKTVLVDNLAHSFGFQIENGIPILEWHQDKNDQELKHLIGYLIEASQAEDVRVFNRDRLRLIELSDSRVEDI